MLQQRAVRAAERQHDWAATYASRLLATDVAVIVWAVFGSQIVWFGFIEENVAISGRFSFLSVSYTAVSVALSIAWVVFTSVASSRDHRILGFGTAEYQRVITSSLMLFGVLGILAYLSKAELARGYFATALPAGLIGLLLSRWAWRQYLTAKRAHGEASSRVVLVGSMDSVQRIARELARVPQAGYAVVAAYTHDDDAVDHVPGTDIPVLSHMPVTSVLAASGADTVVVTSSDDLPADRMRELSWSLEPGRQHLVVAAGITDVAGPRIHTRPVAGLPLIHVETPRYEGGTRLVKRVFDIVVSSGLLLVLSVPLVIIAVLVKASDGPVLFRQTRVGLNGATFSMLKFRSMVPDAEARLAQLAEQQRDAGNTVMFKMADDPRITPVGRVLRRYSLDELPQLFNVLRGEMSLVGPRPPLLSEVEGYQEHVKRRFLVTPGITGLWQVSGRSNLDWDETVRLDLYYVENWSLTADLVILAKTARAVVAREGAY